MKERRSFTPNINGASSLIVIFSVLCLTVFAILALLTVRADARLGDAAAAAVTDYYAADALAQKDLAARREKAVKNDAPAVYQQDYKVSDKQDLHVMYTVNPDGSFALSCWQLVSKTEFDDDPVIPVWQGK